MAINIRIVSTYPPRKCGIATFSRDLASALEHFTGEINSIRVTAIDNSHGPYYVPVDMVISQYEPSSWQSATEDILQRAKEKPDTTVVLLQHEYGLDPDDLHNEGMGTNYVRMAKAFHAKNIPSMVYLHTVLEEPDPHQKQVLVDLAAYCDSMIVTTECAVGVLKSRYGIDIAKIKHIDHGIRMHHHSQFDRLAIKKELGLENMLLLTTLGLQSPGKGIDYGIRGYGRFLQESCTDAQRQQMLYLVAGQAHPEFVRAEGGKPYAEFLESLDKALVESGLRSKRVTDLSQADLRWNDVVFLDTFLDESMLLKLYACTNIMILPYLNMEQMSSGILADTIGSGRTVISTKFRYAIELIHSNKVCPPGLVIGRHARGILVDPGEPSVEQIAEGIDLLVFNKKRRLSMEKQAHQRGYQMRWDNSAWALIQHIEYILDEKDTFKGRSISFKREKSSRFFKGKTSIPESNPDC